MNVARLIRATAKLPMCSAKRTVVYYNDTPDTDKSCQHRAKFIYNDEPLCTKHAQARALRDVLAENEHSS